MSGGAAIALRCDACGGILQVGAGRGLPRCLFCGLEPSHLREVPLPDVVRPVARAPLVVERARAQACCEEWIGHSPLAPFALRQPELVVEVELVLVPVLRFTGEIETHWLGFACDAGTKSGSRPRGGVATAEIRDGYVAASRALRPLELVALGPFGEQFDPLDDGAADLPMEIDGGTERGLREQGLAELGRLHGIRLAREHRLDRIRTTSLDLRLSSEPVLVPVWIGSYRLRGLAWRVLVNGVTGRVTGPPTPWSRVKCGIVVAIACGILTLNPCSTLVLAAALIGLWRLGIVED